MMMEMKMAMILWGWFLDSDWYPVTLVLLRDSDPTTPKEIFSQPIMDTNKVSQYYAVHRYLGSWWHKRKLFLLMVSSLTSRRAVFLEQYIFCCRINLSLVVHPGYQWYICYVEFPTGSPWYYHHIWVINLLSICYLECGTPLHAWSCLYVPICCLIG